MGILQSGMLVQSGRTITPEEVQLIRKTIDWLPGLDRTELAATVCEHLDWTSASGAPKKDACRKLLEKLAADGLIVLPKKRMDKVHSGKRGPVVPSERTDAGAPLTARLSELEAVTLEPVTEAADIGLWNEYVECHHPLGYKRAFGYRLRYFIRSGPLPLGCVLLGGAAKAIAVRDRWIGWSAQSRLRNLGWVVNNTRFLIFPWVHVPHLASHALGQLVRRVATDWQQRWGFSPVLMETFVDPRHYTGTCYRAAGWAMLGETTGQGLARIGKTYHSTPKLVLVKPLHRQFRDLLCADRLRGRGIE